jgi:hypothetical protein
VGRLEKKFNDMENHIEAMLMLLRHLYLLTSPDTKITPERLEQFIRDLRNEAPDENSPIPSHFQDRILLESDSNRLSNPPSVLLDPSPA